MNAIEAFVTFANRVLVREKSARFAAIASTTKGQRRILNALCHEFESAIREDIARRSDRSQWRHVPCYVFHSSLDFGTVFSTVDEAYDKLSLDDGWLIVLQDGSMGLYRPEARWDDEYVV